MIDVFSASLPLRTFTLCVSCSPYMTHVRTPSICQRDTFFAIDPVHFAVPNRKRVIEIQHYQSHKRVVGVPNLCTVRVTRRVCSTSETALLSNPLKFAEFHNQSPLLTLIFHRPFANACLADNEWSIMSFLLGCYTYRKAQSDN